MEPEIFGPYRLEVLIGRGGMGEVFQAVDTSRNRTVAVKRLPRHLAVDEEYRIRFQRESALVAQLREPHVIPIHDYGEIDGQLFIDMRLVEGSDLAAVLTRGPLTVTRAVDIVSQMADALDAAHAEGLVHRDVKPSNILLVSGVTGATTRGVAYLVDFGIARALGGPTLSQTGLAMGSVGYMAPERFTGDDWDHRVDVYSLACVLYQCLVGVKPFAVESLPAAINAHLNTPPPRPSDSRPDLPAGFDELIATGMAKSPAERYASAGNLAFAARSLLTSPSRPLHRPLPHGGVPATGDRAPRPATRPASFRPAPRPRPAPGDPAPQPPIGSPPPYDPAPGTGDRTPDPAPGPPAEPARRPMSRRRMLQVLGGAGALAVAGGAAWGGLKVAGLIGTAGPWTFTTGDKVYSSPAVADGVVYIGSNDGFLYALDAADGTERWRYTAGGSVTSSPAVAAGIVYVGSNDMHLHAVDAATGQARWTAPTGAVTHSSPTVADGTVYVGSRDASLLAFDALSGAPRWRFAASDWFNSSPTVVDGTVYVGCRDRNIYAVTAATGTKRWQFTTESSVDSSPTVVGGVLYIGCDDHRVLALNASDGGLIWQFRAGNGVVSTPAVVGGVVYVGSDDTSLYALESDTGRKRWVYPTGGGIRSSPVVADGVAYVGSQDRFLHAVDALTGAPKWRFETRGPVDDSSPAVSAGLVYVGSLDNTIYAVDVVTGAGK